MIAFFFFILGYLFGSLPVGYLLVKWRKNLDIRKIGSGATGATNVSRILGIKWALLVGLLDFFKAFLPVFLAKLALSFNWPLVLVATSPVLGHIWPIFLQFKGGKGMASMMGSLTALFGGKFILIAFLYAIFYFSIFQIASIFSLTFSSFLPLICFLFHPTKPSIFLGIFLLILIWYAHRENIQRIKSGEEAKRKVDFSSFLKK